MQLKGIRGVQVISGSFTDIETTSNRFSGSGFRALNRKGRRTTTYTEMLEMGLFRHAIPSREV